MQVLNTIWANSFLLFVYLSFKLISLIFFFGGSKTFFPLEQGTVQQSWTTPKNWIHTTHWVQKMITGVRKNETEIELY
jgi:hypothetical protein